MVRSSGRSSGSSRRRNVVHADSGPSYFKLALSLLERGFFYIISLTIQMLPNKLKSSVIEKILDVLVSYFLSNDTMNFWDRLFDHVRSHHRFHTTCTFTHVGRGVLPKVRDEEYLGACFIFSTCGAVSSLITRLKKISVVLAVQQLIDYFDISEYDGGTSSEAYDFIKDNGVVEEKYYPFTGTKCWSQQNPLCRRFFIGGHKYIGRTSSDVNKKDLMKGPVTARMAFYSSYGNYKRGIISKQGSKFEAIHSVLITGFGISKTGHPYFEIQNSHNYNWGFFGLGKIYAELLSDFQVPLSAGENTVVDPHSIS